MTGSEKESKVSLATLLETQTKVHIFFIIKVHKFLEKNESVYLHLYNYYIYTNIYEH